jgi:hypothetical protein
MAVATRILEGVSDLRTLFRLAVVSKQFYRIFKGHELDFIKNCLHVMRPEVWELREMNTCSIHPGTDSHLASLIDNETSLSPCSPNMYLQHYAYEIAVVVDMKIIIMEYRNQLVDFPVYMLEAFRMEEPLLGSEVDKALWRIWTFCRIFGCCKDREDDLIGQQDWFNGGFRARGRPKSGPSCFGGDSNVLSVPRSEVLALPPESFGRGNGTGLSRFELRLMSRVWKWLEDILRIRTRQSALSKGLSHDEIS